MSFFPTLKDEAVESLLLQLTLLDEVILLSRKSDHFAFFVWFLYYFFDLLKRHQWFPCSYDEFRLVETLVFQITSEEGHL